MLWNYLSYGLDPGGFGMHILNNNLFGAMSSAHSSLEGQSVRDMVRWLLNEAPVEAFGNSANIAAWMKKTDNERMEIMIEQGLRPSVIEILSGHWTA
jgi:hypothetical protein